MKRLRNEIEREPRRALYERLEQVVGCKWSVSVLMAIREGVVRPGALERHIAGISTKVLSERLRKLTRYALLEKTSFPEVPPRTEYSLTPAGHELVQIIRQIHALDEILGRGASEGRWNRGGDEGREGRAPQDLVRGGRGAGRRGEEGDALTQGQGAGGSAASLPAPGRKASSRGSGKGVGKG